MLLRRAIHSLLNQTEPPSEIIVVDNAPTDDRVNKLVTLEFPSVRYTVEPVEGLDFARNRALTIASEEVVAFLDDDALANPDWVFAIRRLFENNERLGLFTGCVLSLGLRTEGEKLFEANGSYDRGEELILLSRNKWKPLKMIPAPCIAWAVRLTIGTNFAVRRSFALAIGGFDEALDLGAALPGGGDIDLAWRFIEAGYELIYDPRAIVFHEHRADVNAVCNQIVGHHKGLIAMLTKALIQSKSVTRLSILIYLIWRLFKPIMRIIYFLVGRDPLPLSVLFLILKTNWFSLESYRIGREIAKKRKTTAKSELARDLLSGNKV